MELVVGATDLIRQAEEGKKKEINSGTSYEVPRL